MPRYYFDYREGDRETRDVEGVLLASLDQAREEALRALQELANGNVPAGDRTTSRIAIRERNGPVLMVVSLSLRVQRL